MAFNELKKRKLLIGQEAIVDASKFTLEGRDKKSLRNGLNSLQKKGYKTIFYQQPQTKEIINELKQVSDQACTRNQGTDRSSDIRHEHHEDSFQ